MHRPCSITMLQVCSANVLGASLALLLAHVFFCGPLRPSEDGRTAAHMSAAGQQHTRASPGALQGSRTPCCPWSSAAVLLSSAAVLLSSAALLLSSAAVLLSSAAVLLSSAAVLLKRLMRMAADAAAILLLLAVWCCCLMLSTAGLVL